MLCLAQGFVSDAGREGTLAQPGTGTFPWESRWDQAWEWLLVEPGPPRGHCQADAEGFGGRLARPGEVALKQRGRLSVPQPFVGKG